MNLTRRDLVTGAMAAGAAMAASIAPRISARAQTTTAQHVVEIHRFKFLPDTLKVNAGDTITWINKDIVPHTATAADKSWDTGKIKKGERQTVVVTNGFHENYYCRFHQNMKGAVSVES